MSTINLGFTDGQLTTVDATGSWYASYYLKGQYELSIAEAPGHYVVTIENTPAWQNWRTVVDTPSFQPLTSAGELLIFTDPPVSGSMGTPEPATWAMLLMGMASLVLVKRWRRA